MLEGREYKLPMSQTKRRVCTLLLVPTTIQQPYKTLARRRAGIRSWRNVGNVSSHNRDTRFSGKIKSTHGAAGKRWDGLAAAWPQLPRGADADARRGWWWGSRAPLAGILSRLPHGRLAPSWPCVPPPLRVQADNHLDAATAIWGCASSDTTSCPSAAYRRYVLAVKHHSTAAAAAATCTSLAPLVMHAGNWPETIFLPWRPIFWCVSICIHLHSTRWTMGTAKDSNAA